MKTRIAMYGGTDLSAAESLFVTSLTYALLQQADVTIVTGGYLSSKEKPGNISTDFSALLGAKKYASETGKDVKDFFETWLPDIKAEQDPKKKDTQRFREGVVKELEGESAAARRFLMVRDVDVIITAKGKKYTSLVLNFAESINKPALPLVFTGGDSQKFWAANKDKIKTWFGISSEFATEMENEKIDATRLLGTNPLMPKIVEAINRGIHLEYANEKKYRQIQQQWETEDNLYNPPFWKEERISLLTIKKNGYRAIRRKTNKTVQTKSRGES